MLLTFYIQLASLMRHKFKILCNISQFQLWVLHGTCLPSWAFMTHPPFTLYATLKFMRKATCGQCYRTCKTEICVLISRKINFDTGDYSVSIWWDQTGNTQHYNKIGKMKDFHTWLMCETNSRLLLVSFHFGLLQNRFMLHDSLSRVYHSSLL